MCDPVTISLIGLAATAAKGVMDYTQQKSSANQAESNAKKQESTAEQNMNRANAATPNAQNIISQEQQAAKAGGGSTQLTGPGGVNPAALSLGKQTLLGS